MDKLEMIRAAHLVDQHLGSLAGAVTDERLREKIAALRTNWREMTYDISAKLCDVDSNPLPVGPGRKKRGRQKGGNSADHWQAEPNPNQLAISQPPSAESQGSGGIK